jgi:hypothetical protein
MTHTSMPLHLSSTARLAPKLLMKALVAPYMELKGQGWQAAAEEVNTTQPGSCLASILVTNRWVIGTALTALHSAFFTCRSTGVRSKKPVTMYPALLNTTCTSMSLVAFPMASMYAPWVLRSTPTWAGGARHVTRRLGGCKRGHETDLAELLLRERSLQLGHGLAQLGLLRGRRPGTAGERSDWAQPRQGVPPLLQSRTSKATNTTFNPCCARRCASDLPMPGTDGREVAASMQPSGGAPAPQSLTHRCLLL